MRGWLRDGFAAARIAADRAELWIPGAIVSFAFAGWVVFLAVVAPPADENDIVFLGIQLAASPWWPWNGSRSLERSWPQSGRCCSGSPSGRWRSRWASRRSAARRSR